VERSLEVGNPVRSESPGPCSFLHIYVPPIWFLGHPKDFLRYLGRGLGLDINHHMKPS